MFGYIVVNKPELRIREFYQYRAYYCGLCKALQKKCGIRGQISLNYDMTFLAMLLSCLYDIVNIGLHFFLKNVRPYAASCSEA